MEIAYSNFKFILRIKTRNTPGVDITSFYSHKNHDILNEKVIQDKPRNVVR